MAYTVIDTLPKANVGRPKGSKTNPWRKLNRELEQHEGKYILFEEAPASQISEIRKMRAKINLGGMPGLHPDVYAHTRKVGDKACLYLSLNRGV